MVKTAERISGSDTADNPVFQRHLAAYKHALPYIMGSVAEIGCGEGFGIGLLSPSANDYLAIDKFHSTAVENYSNDPKVHFRQMEVPPFTGLDEDFFDVVVSFQVIEHIKNDREFIKEIWRILKPGGVAVITTPNKAMSLTRNPWHIREYSVSEMNALLGEYFDDYDLLGLYGNEKVMKYYKQNQESVRRITRFDVLNLQYRLPGILLRIPYDILNRMNRNKLKDGNSELVSSIKDADYFFREASEDCLDFFAVLHKSSK